MEALAICFWGLEDIAASEIAELLGGRELRVVGRGRAVFRCSPREFLTLNLGCRTLLRVLVYGGCSRVSLGREGLDEIYRAVRSFEWRELFDESSTFAVRTARHGEHSYTSIDVNRVAGQAIVDYFDRRIKVDLSNPDVVVRCYVIDDLFYFGVDTSGASLHKRGYRVYNHPAPLNPVLASCMLRLSEWTCEKSLLDPMCGSGTILIEAGMMALGIPPGSFRRSYPLARLKPFSELDVREELAKLRERMSRRCSPELYGVDVSPKHIQGAVLNAARAGVHTIDFTVGDFLEVYRRYSVEYALSNPPFGYRSGRRGRIAELYRRLSDALAECVHEVVCIISEAGVAGVLEEELGRHMELAERRALPYGGLQVKMLCFRA